METTFARWLQDRGEAHSAYAIRRGLNRLGVARLAGIGRKPSIAYYFYHHFLVNVSQDTGIPIETLVEEARKAAANPIPPRRYTFRSAVHK
jgi:hypothetical protein